MNAGEPPTSPPFLAPNATIEGDVTLQDDVSIWFGAVVRADKDRIRIERGSNIQDNAVVHTTTGYPVHIGRYVSVGHGAILHGCCVEDSVLVGMGAIVMNGAQVGHHSVIGAGAVVTEHASIPPHSVVLGVPAKVVRSITKEQEDQIMKNALSYIELAGRYRT
ncbi:MAG: gamma carbonic anhydrase family protein [Methanomicrobiaceae archaeon]|nr:gamma carbonic anhydrase family protein [Methanomicrobiaceae archaeon]